MIVDGLTRRDLKSRTTKFGFADSGYLEKFMMDFDAYIALSNVRKCYVRGGMCVPFYVDSKHRRFSKDLDVYVTCSVDEIIEKVSAALLDVGFTRVTPYNHRGNQSMMNNWVRFKASYVPVGSSDHPSASSQQDSISVDITCGIDAAQLDTTLLEQEQNLFDFKIPPPIHTLSRGALIADKITSLGCGPVGYPTPAGRSKPLGYSEPEPTPKQIYDIGMLLRKTTTDDLIIMVQMYNYLTNFKLTNGNRNFGLAKVIQSVKSYISTILTNDTLPRLTSAHSDHFFIFSHSMLSKPHIDEVEHSKNIMLTLLCADFLERSLDASASNEQLAERMQDTLDAAFELEILEDQISYLKRHVEGMGSP